jgi:L-arabinokinase
MDVVFYISGHGFGHASRQIEIINALARRQPDVRVVIRSAVAKWFVDASLRLPRRRESEGGTIDLQPFEPDTGIVQIDSLTLDEDRTVRRAASFYADFDARIRSEANVLRALNPSLVVGDIPPLAFEAADRAGIPSMAIGNFTWDWIYAGYPQFEQLASGVIDRIGAANSRASRALRLPFHGGFETMRHVVDIPLIARRSTRGRAETRRELGLAADVTVVLASFGGYGLGLKYGEIADANRLTVIVTDHEARPNADEAGQGQLVRTTSHELADRGLRYEDLVAASDVVVTKPGYGVVSECIANGTALLYTSRGPFREYDVLVAEMPRVVRCRHIPQHDLREGRWREHVDAILRQGDPPERVSTTGAEVAAREILEAAKLV